MKIVRSLPDRIQSKLTTIEESKNLNIVKIDELKESLQTFELNLRQMKKDKCIPLKSTQEESLDMEEEEEEEEDDDDDDVSLLTKNFNKFFKKDE